MEELLAKALELLSSVEGASVSIALVLEFLFRVIPSEKPLSILHLVAKGCRGVALVLGKVADVLDKVLPQKLK